MLSSKETKWKKFSSKTHYPFSPGLTWSGSCTPRYEQRLNAFLLPNCSFAIASWPIGYPQALSSYFSLSTFAFHHAFSSSMSSEHLAWWCIHPCCWWYLLRFLSSPFLFFSKKNDFNPLNFPSPPYNVFISLVIIMRYDPEHISQDTIFLHTHTRPTPPLSSFNTHHQSTLLSHGLNQILCSQTSSPSRQLSFSVWTTHFPFVFWIDRPVFLFFRTLFSTHPAQVLSRKHTQLTSCGDRKSVV